ncbi:hypothetical protein C8J56DRAFT_879469 [Mycena floridula]|nr:hypothetical protein C8J56DRAFT_879469 [Mycena floridula]
MSDIWVKFSPNRASSMQLQAEISGKHLIIFSLGKGCGAGLMRYLATVYGSWLSPIIVGSKAFIAQRVVMCRLRPEAGSRAKPGQKKPGQARPRVNIHIVWRVEDMLERKACENTTKSRGLSQSQAEPSQSQRSRPGLSFEQAGADSGQAKAVKAEPKPGRHITTGNEHSWFKDESGHLLMPKMPPKKKQKPNITGLRNQIALAIAEPLTEPVVAERGISPVLRIFTSKCGPQNWQALVAKICIGDGWVEPWRHSTLWWVLNPIWIGQALDLAPLIAPSLFYERHPRRAFALTTTRTFSCSFVIPGVSRRTHAPQMVQPTLLVSTVKPPPYPNMARSLKHDVSLAQLYIATFRAVRDPV